MLNVAEKVERILRFPLNLSMLFLTFFVKKISGFSLLNVASDRQEERIIDLSFTFASVFLNF